MAIPDQIPAQVAPPPAPLPPGVLPESPIAAANALLHAVRVLGESAAMEKSGAEAKDYAQAALAAAQAFIVLDPAVDAAGTPLSQHRELERIRGEMALELEKVRARNQLEQAKLRAAAPTPAKSKSVRVRRDEQGRPAAYDLQEGQ